MAKILVFQHVAAEPLGTLDALIRTRGHRIRFYNFSRHPEARPELSRYDGLIVLGGPMNVDQSAHHPHLLTELRAIEAMLAQGKPILGICLGAQLLAHALGAPVYANPVAEIGWYPLTPLPACTNDSVLLPLKRPHPIFQWHGYTFDLPHSAQHLASTEHCPNQAFRYGDNAYGFQFHLEMDQALIERWLSLPAYLDDLEAAGLGHGPAEIRQQTERHIEPLQQLAGQVFNNFLDRIGAPRPRRALPSR